jgi:hypothetical protein
LTFFLITVTIFYLIVTGLIIPAEDWQKSANGGPGKKAPAGLFFGKKEATPVKQGGDDFQNTRNPTQERR